MPDRKELEMSDFTAELHAEPLPRIVTPWHIGLISMGISFILLGFFLPA